MYVSGRSAWKYLTTPIERFAGATTACETALALLVVLGKVLKGTYSVHRDRVHERLCCFCSDIVSVLREDAERLWERVAHARLMQLSQCP